MKYLNTIVFGALGLMLVFGFRDRTPPSKDPWFQSSVTRQPRPVLVKFGAEWCGPCRRMDKVLERAHERLAGQVKIVRVDIDSRPELAHHYRIGTIPRLMLFQDGEVIASHGGFADVGQLQSWVDYSTRRHDEIAEATR